VLECGPRGVRLAAPIEPNLNHRATAFGGSVAALAILAGWALVHLRLQSRGVRARSVIQESSVRYDAPIHGAFEAVAASATEEAWARFDRTLARRGKARIRIAVIVQCGGVPAASFEGAYVAIADRTEASS
jgi:thioesterase domain-containing protein